MNILYINARSLMYITFVVINEILRQECIEFLFIFRRICIYKLFLSLFLFLSSHDDRRKTINANKMTNLFRAHLLFFIFLPGLNVTHLILLRHIILFPLIHPHLSSLSRAQLSVCASEQVYTQLNYILYSDYTYIFCLL